MLASANAAITNDNGLADYSHAGNKKKDPSAPFYFLMRLRQIAKKKSTYLNTQTLNEVKPIKLTVVTAY